MPMAFRGLGRPTDQLDISIAPAEAQGTFAPMPAPAPQAQSGGFFGEGGTGRAIAGYLGDALAQMGGVQPVYAQALAAKREENQYQRQLADRWGLWKQQQDYENAHKAPVYTDLQKNMIAAGIQPGSAEWIKASRGAVQNTSDPIVNANVGGRDFFGPRSLLLDNIGNGGGQESPSPGGGATGSPPASGGFMNLQQFKSMQAAPSFKPGHPAWATPVQISSDAEYDQLPAGKTFIGPDGQVRTKQ